MSRKNIFSNLVIAQADADDPASAADTQPRAPDLMPGSPVRRVGQVLASANEEYDRNIERLKALEAELLAGRAIVEIDPALIDPSPVRDRLGDDKPDPGLIESISQSGQIVPVFLRANRDRPGRYITIYGHRRIAACRRLGKPVRACVADLSDDDALVAQGLENNARRDLSFIEKAYFALRANDASRPQSVIARALDMAQPNVSTMIAIARRIPPEIATFIGHSPKIGQPRWAALADRIDAVDAKTWRAAFKELATRADALETDAQRFDSLLERLRGGAAAPSKTSHQHEWTVATADGDKLATFQRSRAGRVRIEIPRDGDGAFRDDKRSFADWLTSRFADLQSEWRRGE